MHRGRSEDAVACARLAFASSPEKEEIANTCAWVFSNCGQHADAAATYESLLKIRPRWVEGHRHASGSFAAAGQIERAILHAKAASDGDPNSFEFTFHAGCLLESTTQYDDALVYFGRALAVDPGNAAVLRRMSGIKFALEQCDDAVNLALRALSLTPDDPLNAQHAGELLLRVGRFDEAACIMLAAVDAHPNDSVGLRLLSAAQMLCGRTEDALDAIDRALAVAPEHAEYHLHRANLLYRLGRLDEAAEAFSRAAALDPSNPDAKRSQLTVYLDSGRFTEALAIGGELIRAAPENEDYAQAVLQVLNRRYETLDGDYVVLSERPLKLSRELSDPPGFLEMLQTQGRVILALIIRETRTRFGDSKLGYGWALLEPILHILLLSLVFAVMMRGGRRSAINSSFSTIPASFPTICSFIRAAA